MNQSESQNNNHEDQSCCGGKNHSQCDNNNATTAVADKSAAAERVTVKPNFKATKTDTGAELKIDLPGVGKDKLNIKSEENRLTVNAEKSQTVNHDWQLISDSKVATHYELKLETSSDLDLSTTVAKLENGVLTLSIQKHQKSLPREISISE